MSSERCTPLTKVTSLLTDVEALAETCEDPETKNELDLALRALLLGEGTQARKHFLKLLGQNNGNFTELIGKFLGRIEEVDPRTA